MNPLRRAPALLAALALAGCQSGQGAPQSPPPPPAVSDQGVPQAPPPAVAGRSAPSTRPAPPAASAQAVLGYLKPAEDGQKCQWMRHPLPGEPASVFSFNAACDRSMVSWSTDGKQGLVFTWPSGAGEVARAWRVDLGAKSGQPLDLKSLPGGTGPAGPDKPYVSRISFDSQGRPVALIVLAYSKRASKKGVITFEGEQFTAPAGPGVPGLALAYRLEDGGWKRVEAKPGRFEAANAPGLAVLDAAKTLTPVWTASIPTSAQGKKAPADVVSALGAPEDGWWMELPGPDGTLYYRAREEGPEVVMGSPLYWSANGKREELKDVAESDAYLGFQLQRGLLLVTAYGGYAAAHVWSTAAAPKHLADVSGVYAPAFWPSP
ncbi:hypothetical protein JY651_26110 [Pyxidicoccus parkwayensis]|uniref:Lipoprotein n=1 Tax=Pyxidicoccus parkwayensis TaxID=2813578 RepID=A0ABX7NMM0_9BACT|nr:hypothetical protein [Pyxidicoccus parkwaysis]QSQ18835.1 hypothetical protein JY651_26110 [Pyxidicoccus parkwaysis]